MKRLTCPEEQNRSSFFQSGCCLCHIHPDRQTYKIKYYEWCKVTTFIPNQKTGNQKPFLMCRKFN